LISSPATLVEKDEGAPPRIVAGAPANPTARIRAIRLEIGESVDKDIKNLLFDQQMVGG
jgi:hypothetical protein